MDAESNHELLRFYFKKVVAIFFTVVGVISNILVIAIFSMKDLRVIPMNRYLLVLAVADLIIIMFIWPQNIPTLYEKNTVSCKSVWYTIASIFNFCAYIPMIVSIDRYVAVCHSHKFQIRKKLSFQFIILFIFFVISALLAAPLSIFYDAFSDGNSTFCAPTSPTIIFYVDLYNMIFTFVVSFIIMVTTAILITKQRLITRKRLNSDAKRAKKDNILTKTMFGTNLFFLIVIAPVFLSVLYSDYQMMNSTDLWTASFIYDIANAVSLIHNSFSFFVYFICNKIFRKKFLEMIHVRKRAENNQ